MPASAASVNEDGGRPPAARIALIAVRSCVTCTALIVTGAASVNTTVVAASTALNAPPTARTLYRYVVFGVRPLSLNEVVAEVPAGVNGPATDVLRQIS